MSKLNSALKIHDLELKTRLVMPPMATAKAGEQGEVTDAVVSYYDEKSAGGYIGLIITEHSYISQEGKAGAGQVSIAADSNIEGLSRVTEAIHKNGSKVFAQINHAGGRAKTEVTGCTVLAPSAVLQPRGTVVPTEMTKADLEKVVQDFAAAAIRAKKAGYDGVEIHSAHSYLLNQFYSPLSNKRTDEYGAQNMDSRLKLHMEVIRAVRAAVGEDYPVALRLGACDYMEGGSTLEDAVEAAIKLEQAGIDMLDISGGFCGFMRPGATEQGYFAELTEAIKKVVRIPVLLTGGITEAAVAERLLNENKADLIGVGRAVMKDSSWSKNAILSLE